jgi:hypothetical protein
MPLKHGSKIYCQLLLDTNRYKLAEKLAEERGVRVTGMLREFVYSALSQIQPQEYDTAKAADEEAWKESVQRRVEGRQRSKQEKGESNKDA